MRGFWRPALARYPDVLRGYLEPNVGERDLDHFIVLADRVVFLFDYGLPRAVAVATPQREISLSAGELRSLIR